MSIRNEGGLLGRDDTNRFVYVTAVLAALNGLLFGFDTGVISGALLYIGETFPLLGESAAIEGISSAARWSVRRSAPLSEAV